MTIQPYNKQTKKGHYSPNNLHKNRYKKYKALSKKTQLNNIVPSTIKLKNTSSPKIITKKDVHKQKYLPLSSNKSKAEVKNTWRIKFISLIQPIKLLFNKIFNWFSKTNN